MFHVVVAGNNTGNSLIRQQLFRLQYSHIPVLAWGCWNTLTDWKDIQNNPSPFKATINGFILVCYCSWVSCRRHSTPSLLFSHHLIITFPPPAPLLVALLTVIPPFMSSHSRHSSWTYSCSDNLDGSEEHLLPSKQQHGACFVLFWRYLNQQFI